ncbi:MAG: endonuclease [Gammaproteobacteria bacterium]|nr:endonuclease [Gammaproteobacteria bacterium]NIR98693.1 endonuclease [Gammaproteobacteria bacterium]NIT64408.1 endonuclease [Gammaproteobacteria bacterium]NIV21333.1 endonuclease [Gammaproteobacteria bacterium]NIV76454.1 endonuclease [Gammaproteobacteria bacterium]
MEGQRFSVATYNIHRCIGRDDVKDPDRIARVIRAMDATVIGLQEVETVAGHPRHRDQFTYVAHASGYTAIPGPTLFRPDGHYGNALLTRANILAIRRHDLTVPPHEPRGAIDAELALPRGGVRVVVTHLGLNAAERARQIRHLVNVLDTDGNMPAVVLADLNEWWPWGRRLRGLREHLHVGPVRPSFPAPLPVLALDRVLLGPGVRLVSAKAVWDRTARRASDHLPIRAILELTGFCR